MVTTIDTSDRTLNILKTMVISNDDLLIQILCRLPAKSILRFKCVSKHWLSLLSNRHFTLMFNKRSVSPGLFFKDEYIPFEDDENQSTRPFRSLNFCHDPHGIRIVQSCNGLLLCCSDNESERGRKYYVFNPTTKQFVVIPPFIGGEEVYLRISFMGLAFHHTDCEHFKVVRVYPASRDRKTYQIQIYSSDTAKWRILSQFFPLSRQFAFSLYGVYWNGALYWGRRGYEPFYFKFDVERLQSLPLPSYQDCRPRPDSFSPRYLGESRGHLHLVEKPRLEGPLHFNVYELLRDHSGWLFKYQVKHSELHTAYPPHDEFDIKILDVVRGEKEEDTFLVVRIYESIIRYNILDKTFKPIFIFRGRFQLIDKAHHYIETIGSFSHK